MERTQSGEGEGRRVQGEIAGPCKRFSSELFVPIGETFDESEKPINPLEQLNGESWVKSVARGCVQNENGSLQKMRYETKHVFKNLKCSKIKLSWLITESIQHANRLSINHFFSKIKKEIEFLRKQRQTACQEEPDSAIRELFVTVCLEKEGKHDPTVFDFTFQQFLRRSDPTLIVRWASNKTPYARII
ncbi:hypothetical protein CEXT_392341 [Caerostris extrusa]|uniref:Uncharacterized protein n=1 Tax=Caerostris extrusa TaxID=172846 RepID=A0AAV4Y6R1_CAEEX|nr:hypothetical protein CEXT_392341 [Caerostris extrusa]